MTYPVSYTQVIYFEAAFCYRSSSGQAKYARIILARERLIDDICVECDHSRVFDPNAHLAGIGGACG